MSWLRRFRRDERGLSFVSFLLILALAAGVYVAFKFGPVYLENSRVKRLVRAACANWVNVDKDLERVKTKLDVDLEEAMVEHVYADDVKFERVSDEEVRAYLYYEVEVKHPIGKPTKLDFEFEHTEHRRLRAD